MEKYFNSRIIEKKHYQRWEDAGYFSPTSGSEAYSIMIPPPNVTGSLHMGHAFGNSIMDALIRYQRMMGKNTLWQVGTDHAGIATQMVVERKIMAEENKSRHDYGRDAFIDKIWQWKQESGNTITRQLRRLGASVDWHTERFTMDEGFCAGVNEAFIKLYEDGIIYRGKRLVNWDPALQTAISDVEVENKETQGSMWYIKYNLTDAKLTTENKSYIVVATTRPETMFGDAAVAVNPEDTRYQQLIGSYVTIPLSNRRIPIIADEHADMTKGTGCVKITPAHDFNDYQVGIRNNLPLISIMDKSANILAQAEIYDSKGKNIELSVGIPVAYHGLNRFTARENIVAELQNLELLAKQESHNLTIPYGDRSAVIIEPLLTDQWFVDTSKLAQPAIATVENNDIEFFPNQYKNMYLSWMNDIQDWCISRQLWWGHRIPAWFDDSGNIYVGRNLAEVRAKYKLAANIALTPDPDVLDTWFSSSLWTFASLGWPENTDRLKQFHPSNVLVTGFDIIFFWVARMIFMSLYLVKDSNGKPQIPFKKVYITGLIRDEKGVKMSKTKGNVLDPLDMIDGIKLEELIEKRCKNMMQPKLAKKIEQATRKEFPDGIDSYGTDALRFTLYSLASTGRNINWDMNRLKGYRNFCNKLWNATNYVLLHTENFSKPEQPNYSLADRWIQSILQKLIEKIHTNIAEFRFDHAAHNLYNFVWNEYCAWYLELSKPILFNKDSFKEYFSSTQFTLLQVLENICRLLHPFIPFITEEIWLNVIPKLGLQQDTLMTASYPQANNAQINEVAEAEVNWIKAVVTAIRSVRTDMNIGKNKPLDVFLKNASAIDKKYLDQHQDIIQHLTKVSSFKLVDVSAKIPQSSTLLIGTMELHVSMEGIIDINTEKQKQAKELAKLEQDISRLQAKLSNDNFINNAPAQIVKQEQEKLEKYNASKQRIEALLSS
jgi:valyl-tRNA synthetase